MYASARIASKEVTELIDRPFVRSFPTHLPAGLRRFILRATHSISRARCRKWIGQLWVIAMPNVNGALRYDHMYQYPILPTYFVPAKAEGRLVIAASARARLPALVLCARILLCLTLFKGARAATTRTCPALARRDGEM
jgi:hypothetical protein